MIHHTKLFVRRLAYTPWLLVAGLVLGWAGEAAAQLTVSVSSTGAREGETMTFDVFLSSAVSGDNKVTVDYSLTAGATNPAHLTNDLTDVNVRGTLTFSADEVAVVHRVDVHTKQDEIDEHDETFTITLSNARGATIAAADAGGTGLGTIYDDDLEPELSIADAEAYEGSTVNFTVTLSAPTEKVVSVEATVRSISVNAAGTPATGEDADAGPDSDPPTPADELTAEGADFSTGSTPTTSIPLTFSPASVQTLTQIVSVATLNDANHEDDEETFEVTLSPVGDDNSPTSPLNALIRTATATGKILDNDPAPSISLAATGGTPGLTAGAVNEAEATDGTPNTVVFTATLTGTTDRNATVSYSVGMDSDDTVDDADFTAAPAGDLTFTVTGSNATPATAEITVSIVDDSIGERPETITVMLVDPTSAVLGSAAVTFTINADENDPVVLSVMDAEATEADGATVDFEVMMSAPRATPVTVMYETSIGDNDTAEAGDFTATMGTLTIAAEATSGTVSVPIVNDTVDEVDRETFTLTLSDASTGSSLGNSTATGTIIDDDNPPSFSVADASAEEGEVVEFMVKVSALALADMTVDYKISTGEEGEGRYTAAESNDFDDDVMMMGTLTFMVPEEDEDPILIKMVSVATRDDGDDENNENFTLTLSNPTIGGEGLATPTIADGSAVGTIIDNDGPPSLSVADAEAAEGETVDFMVTLTLANDMTRTEDVTVNYATSPGTATSADFKAATGTLTFAADATGDALTQTVSVATTQDETSEDAETFTLTLSSVSANAEIGTGTWTATGTIMDDDGETRVKVADAEAVEGNSVNFPLTVSPVSTSEMVLVFEALIKSGDSASSSDLTLGEVSVTIPPLGTSGMVRVNTTSDLIREGDETFTLTFIGGGDLSSRPADAKGTIVDDEAVPAEGDITLTLTPSSVREDGGTATIAVKAAVPADAAADTYVALSLEAGSDRELNKRFRITLPTVTIPKGKKEGTGEITFIPISTDADNSDLVITIVANSGTQLGAATITMIDAHKDTDEITLSFDPASMSEEEGPKDIVVTATLNGAVQTKALTFALRIDDDAAQRAADAAGSKERAAVRDEDYTTISLGSITIPRKRVSGSTTITIDPRSQERTVDAVLVGVGARPSSLNDGAITVTSGIIKITDAPLASVKGLTATPGTIRENAGTTEVALKVTLTAALPNDEDVSFTIMDAVESGNADVTTFLDGAVAAERDVNYTAIVGDLTIAAGATEGTTTLTLTPVDNDARGSALGLIVRAKVGNTTFEAGVKIVDDETPTTNIALSVAPAEVKAATGANEITVTGEINGSTFDDPVKIALVLAPKDVDGATAQRDTDYEAVLRSLTVPAGEVRGSTTISVTALTGGNKKVVVKALKSPVKNDDDDDVTVGMATITLKDADPTTAPPDPGVLRFGADLAATTFDGVIGEAFEQELPEAEGGGGDRSYSVSANLPDGLAFDTAKRMIAGSPTTAGMVKVVYTVIDTEGNSAATQFTIEVTAAPPPTVAVASVEASQQSIRESGDTTEISITATLAGPAPDGETVEFRLGAPSSGAEAIRDVDYAASLGGSVAIEKGATEASTTLTLTPIDNDKVDGNKSLGVQASASGGSASVDIKIADDETASTSIALSADPHTVSESDGVTDIVVTATLGGKVLDAEAIVIISIDPASKATRDEDYAALFNPRLTIPAGSISGSIALIIDPNADSEDEGNETITLNGVSAGLTVEPGTITISDGMMAPDDPMMDPLAFAEGAMISDVASTAGTAVSAMELPAAAGGEGDITYSVSDLPAGLTFDAATRMVSGTPEAEGTTEVTYTATDGAGATVTLTFSITVNPMLDFGDLSGLFGAFSGAAGKANPASEHDEGAIQIIVGQPYSLTIPEIPGGTPPKTYSVVGLPAGLTFDAATRTVSGTPTEIGLAAVVLTVVDAAGATGSVPIPVSVIEPPLGAPSNLVAQDYAGADGQGDQGGFLLLTWELSEHHDEIDGYRIFRALPVLGNEMVPWAMVDAVPGVARGVAIVATLDNVSTRWGIAAERGGQTTHGAAKAVFVSAENQPYAQMAETLMASMEAAQAGDAPVFASLLPEALAYAQGVAPKLNVVAGVQSSEVIFTDEPVRAIDNIAPLAVPSLSVLDAPNDQGSRIALTWTLSPSDRILQDVVAGAVGPLGAEPVVGVYGYNIYRRAAGEDEFAKIAQVDAGVTSFVDETALNGVRYTYQVRPYDLDNETGSDIEQTAMAVRNIAVDSEGRALFGLFGADNRIGFDDFFIFADSFGLTAEDTGFDPAFDLSPNATIDFEDFFVFADNFGRSTAAAGKRVPMFAGLNADARMYLDARTAMPIVGEDFVLDVRVADFAAIKGYGLQVAYEADKLEFVEVLTDEPLGGSAFATPQVLADEAGVLTVVAHGDVVSDGEVALSLVFRPTTEIEHTLIEIADNQTYDSAFGFNRLALPAPVQLQTRPAVFALASNYPNPFNPATTIKYALPQAADVELTVYNVVGQVVRTLVAEHQSAGRYVVEWDATNDNGHSLSSGMYFYRLQAGGEFHEVKKMLLLK
ncbi:MAG: putative Ig domain-containing protein [Gemmatimonadota bacterium]|nr:putative Ig domain-containing protein [Gemmatimonadota bacterium]